ncbi:MAG TPA: hypothetical protein VIH05_02955 [Tepidiformaceae bacterium]
MTVASTLLSSSNQTGDEATETLLTARRVLATALCPPPPDGVRAWIGEYLAALDEAESLLRRHSEICGSEDGPLLHLGQQRPRLQPQIVTRLDEHDTMLSQIESLRSRALDLPGDDAKALASLSYDTLLCEGRMFAHLNGVLDLVFEATHVDIGGEGG